MPFRRRQPTVARILAALTCALLLAACSGKTSGGSATSSVSECAGARSCVDFTLAGALTGRLSTATPLSAFTSCEVLQGDPHVWFGRLYGDVKGHPWQMTVEILKYLGPGTYNAGISVTPTPSSNSESYVGNGSVTIGAGARSGTVRAGLSDEQTHTRTLRVSGNFRCPSD